MTNTSREPAEGDANPPGHHASRAWARHLDKAQQIGAAFAFEIANALALIVVFPLTIRSLGTEEYGQYATMYVIAGLAITWVYAGAGAATVQLILQRERTPASVVRTAHRQVATSAVPAGLVGAVITYVVLGRDLLGPALLIFGSDLLVAGLAEAYITAVYARRGVQASVLLRMISPLVRLVGVAGLATIDSIGITTLVVVNLAATATTLAAAVVAARPVVREPAPSPGGDSSPRELLGLSMMYSTSISTNTVQIEGEKFLLAVSRPSSEVGEYQAAYRVVSAALIPLKAVAVAANLWFLRRDDRVGTQTRRSMLLSLATVAYGIACGVAIVLGRPIIAWVVGDEFSAAVDMAMWLAAVPLFQGLAEVPLLGLLGLGENRRRMLLGLVTAAFATACYLSLIPWLGWRGAVIGTYVSEAASILGGWWVLVRCQRRSDQRGSEEPGR